MTYQSDGVLVQ